VVAGTVFASATHPGRRGAGPDLISACATAGLPVIAIGGIDESRVGRVMEAGAAGVAAVRAVWEAADPIGSAMALIDAVRRPAAGGE
jgi:thiamine monophosphate synthase